MARRNTRSDRPPWIDWVNPRFVDHVCMAKGLTAPREWWQLRRALSVHGKPRLCFLLGYWGEPRGSRVKKVLWLRTLGVSSRILAENRGPVWTPGISLQMQEAWGIAQSEMALESRRPMTHADVVRLPVQPKAMEWANRQLRTAAGMASFPWIAVFAEASL